VSRFTRGAIGATRPILLKNSFGAFQWAARRKLDLSERPRFNDRLSIDVLRTPKILAKSILASFSTETANCGHCIAQPSSPQSGRFRRSPRRLLAHAFCLLPPVLDPRRRVLA